VRRREEKRSVLTAETQRRGGTRRGDFGLGEERRGVFTTETQRAQRGGVFLGEERSSEERRGEERRGEER